VAQAVKLIHPTSPEASVKKSGRPAQVPVDSLRPGQAVEAGRDQRMTDARAARSTERRRVMAVKRRTSERARGRSIKVWRFMSFGRFVWMLKKKALWMCRVDQLDDAWEMAIAKQELDSIIEADAPAVTYEEALVRQERGRSLQDTIRDERGRTFVNCWTASNGESHAMWSVYCGSKDGVAVQTTLKN
jgi:hypothetical protein